MFGTILKATNSSFQKGMTFCRSVYVKKVMKLLAFIFEQPSYEHGNTKYVRYQAAAAAAAAAAANVCLYLYLNNTYQSLLFKTRVRVV